MACRLGRGETSERREELLTPTTCTEILCSS